MACALRGNRAIVNIRLFGIACFASYKNAHNVGIKTIDFEKCTNLFDLKHLNFRKSQQITNEIAADESA